MFFFNKPHRLLWGSKQNKTFIALHVDMIGIGWPNKTENIKHWRNKHIHF